MSFIKNKKGLSFDEFLSESTYYSDTTTKNIFIGDESNLATGFMFSFLGMLGLLNGAKNKNILLTHFRKDKKLQIATINDNNNNTSLIIKLMDDAGAFRSSTVSMEITRFLVLLRSGAIGSVSDLIVRGWIDNINLSWLSKNLDNKLKLILKEFRDPVFGSLHLLATRLFKIRSAYPDNIVEEFIDFARLSGFEKKVLKGSDPELDEPAPEAPAQQEVIKLPSLEQIVDVTMSENFDFKTIKEDSTRKILKLISVSVDSYNKPYGNDPEYPTKEEMDDVAFLEKNKQLLDSCLIPAIEKMGQFYFNLLYDRLTKKSVFNKLNNLEKYFRILLLKSHDNIKNLAIIEIKMGKGLYNFWNVFGDSNIEKEFGSFMNFAELIFSSIDINDVATISKLSNVLIASDISEFQKNRLFFTKKFLESIVSLVEQDKKLPRKFMTGWEFDRNVNTVTIGVPLNEIDPYVLRMKQVIISLPKNSEEYKDEIKFIMDLVSDSSIKGDFPKALNKHFADLYIESLDELDLDKFDSGEIIRRITVTKNNITSILENLLPKIKQKPLVMDQKAGLMQALTNRHQFIIEIDNIDEIIKILEQCTRALDITDKDEKEYIFTELFYNFLVFESFARNKNHNQIMIDMMLYKDQNFPNILRINQIFERFERLVSVGVFNNVSKEQSEKIAKAIIDNPNGYFSRMFSKETIKSISNREQKSMLKEFYFDLIFDNIEKNPRLVNDLYEGMDVYFQNQIRSKMIAANSIVGIVQKGPIFPFENLSTERLKEILSFNNIDIEAGLGSIKLPRKLKTDTISSYLEKVKPVMAEIENTIVGKLKVEENNLSVEDLNKKTIDIVNKTFAGKHGSIYPKIIKSFTVSLPADRYDAFTREMERAGIDNKHIIPAFHGTGGVAATCILRYGFKVLSSKDALVTGRMLGDGIYFAVNIDKSLQYVGNQGYGRSYGTKGYIFEMDAQLGKEGENYKAAGIDGQDHIRSPEWVVKDGNAQLKIMTAYEVELISKSNFELLSLSEALKPNLSFKEFYMLNEETSNNPSTDQQRFIFWDGNIPMPNGKILPFEKAKSLGKKDVRIEKTPNGPAVVFYNTKGTAMHDIRFAAAMKEEARTLYYKLLMARQ